MMSSRLEPMSTTLMISHRSDAWAACKCVGALLRCVLIRTGTRTGPATAALDSTLNPSVCHPTEGLARACGKVRGGRCLKVQDENGALSATNLRFLPFPAAFSLGRPPLPQPFCAAQALDGRKGLLEVLGQRC